MEFKPPKEMLFVDNIADKWKEWFQQFNIFLIASSKNDESDERKINILLNLIGPQGIKIYNNFKKPKKDADIKYDHVVKWFSDYCQPRKNVIFQRFKFGSCVQKEGQSFDEFVTELKTLASTCEYKEEDNMVRDRIVFGIRDAETKNKLLSMDNLTLENAEMLCRTREVTDKEIQEMSTEAANVLYLGREQKNNWVKNKIGMSKNKYNKSKNYSNNNKSENKMSKVMESYNCKKCGTNHKPRSCPAYGKECRVCKKLNHFEIGCKNKNKNKKVYKTSVVNEINSDDEINNEFNVQEIKNVFKVGRCGSWSEIIEIGNLSIVFKLDSGSDVNILPYNEFIKIKPQPLLSKSNYNIEAYGGYKINCIGSCMVECTVKNLKQNCSIEFLVVKPDINKSCCPILGLSTCEKYQLIKRVNELELNTSEAFINKNIDVFSGLGQFPELYNLELKNNYQPRIVPYRRVPLSVKDRYELKLKSLIDQKVLDYVNKPTDWTNHVVVIEKPNKSLRICLDPQNLNKNIKDEQFPIPTLNEIAPKLINKKYFTVLDLKDGFWQIGLTEFSSNLCAFASPLGTLKFNKLPFGLKIAPAVFQKYNTKYFGDIKGLIIYFDDFIVAAETKEEHDIILDKLIKRAREYNIKFNKEKLQYCKSQVKFLGHLFDQNGMKLDPSRIEAIQGLKPPTSKKELQRLLGFINYVRSFIPNFSELTAPIRNLLKKDSVWEWTGNQTKALNLIKDRLTKSPVLSSFDPSKSITIQTDSSQSGLGCCLLQNNQPVAYASRSLSPSETQWAQIEKEMAAILFACNKFHEYIYGRNVLIHSDHKPLVSIMLKDYDKIKNNRLKRIKTKLAIYNINVQYLPGKKMFIADFLSRDFIDNFGIEDKSVNDYVHIINTKKVEFSDEKLKEFQLETLSDPILSKILDYYNSNWPSDKSKLPNLDELRYFWNSRNDITINDGLVYINDKIIVPFKLRRLILSILHETHLGINKTTKRAKSFYYWPGIAKDIEKLINNCYLCAKFQRKNTRENLLSYKIPKRPFEKIGIDIAEYGSEYFLIVIDYYSRWLEVLKLHDKTADSIINSIKPIFSRFGIPSYCVSDNMPFNSYIFKQFSKDWNFQIITTSPNYPQSNGLVEKSVGIVKSMMRKCHETGQDLELYLLNYRSSQVAGLNYSPAEILQNRVLRTKLPVSEESLVPKIPIKLYENMKEKQIKQQKYYNKSCKSKEKKFKKGDSVLWLKNKIWEVGVIVGEANTPRSYLVKDARGKIFRRTTFHLKLNKTNVVIKLNNQKEREAEAIQSDIKQKTRSGRLIIKPVKYRN